MTERGRSASHDPVETLLKTAQANVNLSAELLQQIKQARSQAIDDCIKVVREKRDEYGYAKQGHDWGLYEHMASRLEALKQ